jgi:ABC-type transport system involved in cytochrome c biogenesis permease subunit
MIAGWGIFPIFAIIATAIGVISFVAALCGRKRLAQWMICGAIGVLLLFILQLWLLLDRPPMRTMGETRLWYSLFLFICGAFAYRRWGYSWLLGFAVMMATVFMAINYFKPEIHDQSLMPALQSVWFIPHVSIYIFSYALLGCATMLSLVSLLGRQSVDEAMESLTWGGVAFFTVGMLTGALWAKEAWGEYWSWDAKESWAAATWMLYLLSMHLPRLGYKDKKIKAVVMSLAFICLQMCWYGVNYLPSAVESIHVYNR